MLTFERSDFAPCGINCATCYGQMRLRNKCAGCWSDDGFKPNHCRVCRIRNCEYLKETDSKFCYECVKFPCQRMKQLDKRYSTKYRAGLINNLLEIKKSGIEEFINNEPERWACPKCGSLTSIHLYKCITCDNPLTSLND